MSPISLGNARYVNLANAFNFETDGSVATGLSAQSDAQLNGTIFAYYDASGSGASPAAAAQRTQYFTNTIGSVTSVDDLLNDDTLFTYALTAFGLNPTLHSKDTIRQVLVSDLTDPDSFANTLTDTRYRTLAAAFNFATDGTISGSRWSTVGRSDRQHDRALPHALRRCRGQCRSRRNDLLPQPHQPDDIGRCSARQQHAL